MFNFLASQHRELPDIAGPFDEEDDEFPLKSSRWVDGTLAMFLNLTLSHNDRSSKLLKRNEFSRCHVHADASFSVINSDRRATSSELPMAMRFRHLEKLSKEAVGVYR